MIVDTIHIFQTIITFIFQMKCALLAFLLYFFGLSVFFWQFLKAAQLSGKFDEFFAKGRNIYLFYFLLGWSEYSLYSFLKIIVIRWGNMI